VSQSILHSTEALGAAANANTIQTIAGLITLAPRLVTQEERHAAAVQFGRKFGTLRVPLEQ
jgi:hypothetical protein